MHRRWLRAVIEIGVSLAAATLLALWCSTIRIDPLQRVGQISGLATIQIRFLCLAIPLVIALVVTSRVRGGQWFALASRIACAALAGLASAYVASGIIVALRGTPYCLNANAGDSDIIVMWANGVATGVRDHQPPAFYPPLFPYVLHYYSELVDVPAVFGLKHLQIIGTTLAGPLAYGAWRLVLRPGWALAIGIIATLVVLDPYKIYGSLVLVVFMPLAIRYLARMRDAGGKHPFELVRTGVLYGLTFGVLMLAYSGWFRWAAPGLVIAAAFVFPWRNGWKKGLLLGGVTLVMILAVDWNYLTTTYKYAAHVSESSGGKAPMIVDDYFYFDTAIDPTYFAMWKGDLPGTTQTFEWPPPGELGGVGLYSILLFAGLGVAIALGRRRTELIAVLSVLVAVWVQRFWVAHNMYMTKLVQLWPRTTILIAYLFVVIAGLGAYYLYERMLRRAEDESPLRSPNASVGAFVALIMMLGSMASSISDRYMPLDTLPRMPGFLSFAAHAAKRPPAPPPPAPAPEPPAPEPPAPEPPK